MLNTQLESAILNIEQRKKQIYANFPNLMFISVNFFHLFLSHFTSDVLLLLLLLSHSLQSHF